MRRKVSLIGPSTLMVSLPSRWVKRHMLKKGDELEVEEKECQLIVSTNDAERTMAVKTDFSDFQGMVLRGLAAIYKKGYDDVEITFDNPAALSSIQEALRKEISYYEIVEQGKSFCRLKSVAETKPEEFEPILRRTFITMLNMAEDMASSMRSGDFTGLERACFLEETNNKYTTFCRRSINKHSTTKPENAVFMYLIVEQLEKIADQYKYLCQSLSEAKKNEMPCDKSIALFERHTAVFRLFYECFYKYDKSRIMEISRARKEIVNDALSMIQKSSGKETLLLHHTLTSTQQVFALLGPYLAMHF